MKKLLSLLLALCMLLPAGALADAVQMRLNMQIDREMYRELLLAMAAIDSDDAAVQESVADLVTELICGVLEVADFECILQDNGFQCTFLLQDERIVDAAVTLEGNEVVVSSSMLGDIVLVQDISQVTDAAASVSWASLLNDLMLTAEEWYVTRDMVYDAAGSYAGNAYEGGNERVVIRLDDADIALLVEGLLQDVENSTLMAVMEELFGADAVQQVVRAVREANYRAALNNEYTYELATVYHADGWNEHFVGFSLNVMQDGAYKWSLSCGVDDAAVRVIAAFDVAGNTNFFAYTEAAESLSNQTTRTTATMAIYQAEQGSTYASVSAAPEKALMYSESIQESTMTGTPAHYRKETTGTMRTLVEGEETFATQMSYSDVYAQKPYTFTRKVTVSQPGSDVPYMMENIIMNETEPFAQPEGKERISLAEALTDTQAQEKLAAQLDAGVTELGILVFRHLPAELMTVIMQQLMQ